MMDTSVVDIVKQSLYGIIIASTVVIVPGLVVGLVVSIIQAAMQINEATLSFFPKLVVMILIISFLAPWLMGMLSEYTTGLISEIPYLIG